MRLLNINTLQLRDFPDQDNIPPYVIASHRWLDDRQETTYQKFREGTDTGSLGYKKVQGFCEAHLRIKVKGSRRISQTLGLDRSCDWLWIDTACIDKSNSAELTRSLNSMFRWYQSAQICYAYLSDVSTSRRHEFAMMDFMQSSWFTRGWTLQELLAPGLVVFLSKEWQVIGHKCSHSTCNLSCWGLGNQLNQKIARITNIPLLSIRSLKTCLATGVEEKKRWAAARITKEIEDRAYCMMGLFGVYLPLIYGEGDDAWRRLEDEVKKKRQSVPIPSQQPLGRPSSYQPFTPPQASGPLGRPSSYQHAMFTTPQVSTPLGRPSSYRPSTFTPPQVSAPLPLPYQSNPPVPSQIGELPHPPVPPPPGLFLPMPPPPLPPPPPTLPVRRDASMLVPTRTTEPSPRRTPPSHEAVFLSIPPTLQRMMTDDDEWELQSLRALMQLYEESIATRNRFEAALNDHKRVKHLRGVRQPTQASSQTANEPHQLSFTIYRDETYTELPAESDNTSLPKGSSQATGVLSDSEQMIVQSRPRPPRQRSLKKAETARDAQSHGVKKQGRHWHARATFNVDPTAGIYLVQQPPNFAIMYSPLKTGEIRLLRLLDDTGHRCTLTTHNISNAPKYNCFSYAWDEDEAEDGPAVWCPITIDGQEKRIRKNLFDALSQLGRTVRRRQCSVWIDAICINQDDLEERASQVRQMTFLYEHSEEVMAWIGPSYDHGVTMLGAQMMHIMTRSLAVFKSASFKTTTFDWWLNHFKDQPEFQNEQNERIYAAWAGIVSMLKRPYWGRTWVHQEASVPQTRFYCGHHSFTWADLSAFNHFHSSYAGLRKDATFSRNELQRRYILQGWNEVGAPVLDLLVAQVNRQAAAQEHRAEMSRLLTLLRQLRLTTCTDARDKVFAAIPHARDVAPNMCDELLSIDYSMKTVVDVYVDVARYCIKHGKSLEILAFVCMPTRPVYRPPKDADERPLPSWVPDWRIASRLRPLNAVGLLHGAYPVMYKPLPNDDALEAKCIGNELHVKALIFDEICTTTKTVGRETNEDGMETEWKGHLIQYCSHFTDSAFNRTLVGDARQVEGESPARSTTTNVRGGSFDFDLFHLPPAMRTPEIQTRRWTQFHALRGMTRDRRAGCTKGQRLGIFPEASRQGDRIAAFHGGDALYVIREVDVIKSTFHFVGECYVDGMMDGQLVNLAAEKDISDWNIILV